MLKRLICLVMCYAICLALVVSVGILSYRSGYQRGLDKIPAATARGVRIGRCQIRCEAVYWGKGRFSDMKHPTEQGNLFVWDRVPGEIGSIVDDDEPLPLLPD